MSRHVAAIVLAGGASRRMGRAKAGLVHEGRTFLAHVLGALRGAGIDDVIVVSGSAHDAVLAALPTGDDARVLRNPDPERGQLSSLKIALGALRTRQPRPDAAVMALVDHPAGVPYVTVLGRRGGSAVTAAAVNALAHEKEIL